MPPQLKEPWFSADSAGLGTWCLPSQNHVFCWIPTKHQGFTWFLVEYGFDNLKPQLKESLFSADSGGPETWCLPGKNQVLTR